MRVVYARLAPPPTSLLISETISVFLGNIKEIRPIRKIGRISCPAKPPANGAFRAVIHGFLKPLVGCRLCPFRPESTGPAAARRHGDSVLSLK